MPLRAQHMPTCPVECPACLRVPWPGDGSGGPKHGPKAKSQEKPGIWAFPGISRGSKPGFASRVSSPPVPTRVTTRVRYMPDPGFFPDGIVGGFIRNQASYGNGQLGRISVPGRPPASYSPGGHSGELFASRRPILALFPCNSGPFRGSIFIPVRRSPFSRPGWPP